jgi:hypothetical protein
MGLNLCIFDGDKEVDGVEVGPYADFDAFRNCVIQELERGNAGSKFPTLILPADSDGRWSPAEAGELKKGLVAIGDEFHRRPPVPIEAD